MIPKKAYQEFMARQLMPCPYTLTRQFHYFTVITYSATAEYKVTPPPGYRKAWGLP